LQWRRWLLPLPQRQQQEQEHQQKQLPQQLRPPQRQVLLRQEQ
jgi:hypothetical protein